MAWSSLTALYYSEVYTNNSTKDKGDYFTQNSINGELQSGTISNYSGYNLDGDTTFLYTLTSTGGIYEVAIDTRGKARIIAYNDNIIIRAEYVSFTPEDSAWAVENVKEALDYLYNN